MSLAGFQYVLFTPLCVMPPQATNLITKKELLTVDPDTDDGQLVYEITSEPKHGFLESKLKPGTPISTFTQGTELPAPAACGAMRQMSHSTIFNCFADFQHLGKARIGHFCS